MFPKIVLLFFLAFSGCQTVQNPALPKLTTSEKMEWSTYAIGTTKGMATCVIVNRRDVNAPSGAVPVLVTSAHVLSVAPHGPYFLAARIPKSGASPDIAILEFQIPSDRQPAYVKHPRHDVAAIALRIPSDIAKEISLPSFLNESAIATRGTEPHVGEEISVLGFPRVFPGTEGGFAVLRGGKIASYSAGPTVSREKFLVNATVIRETLELLAQREDQPLSTSPISPGSVAPPREERVKLVAPPRFFADTIARNSSLIRIRLLPRK
jgi:hypothetical protein